MIRILVATLALAVGLGAIGGCGDADPTTLEAPADGTSETRELEVGFADALFSTADGDLWAARAGAAGADSIRVNLYWNIITPSQPVDPRDPADPAYQWEPIDTAIRAAGDHGMSVLLTVLSAPPWAEGPDRPTDLSEAPAGTWRPDPGAYGDFAHALAVRYSGDYPDPTRAGETLPAVKYFSAWNEPNTSTYLTPQFVGTRIESAVIYTELLSAFYEEVKAVNPDAQVATGGTAPFGDAPGGQRTRPMQFWREVFCIEPDGARGDCPAGTEPRFDLLAHHPIIVPPAPPERSYPNEDDIGVADIGRLIDLLRSAERLGTVEPAGEHPLIVPEIWWDSDPPKPGAASPAEHGRYTARALYMLWKQGVEAVWFLQLRDAAVPVGEPLETGYEAVRTYHTGIFTVDGEPKPAYDAVRFPFATERVGDDEVIAWGQAPIGSGQVTVSEEVEGNFVEVASVDPEDSGIFEIRLEQTGSGRFVASQGEVRSLVTTRLNP